MYLVRPAGHLFTSIPGIERSNTQSPNQKLSLADNYACALSCSVISDFLQPHGLYSSPGSSVHGILQARVLEWTAISSSSGYSQPRDRTHVSCIGRRILYHWAPKEAPQITLGTSKNLVSINRELHVSAWDIADPDNLEAVHLCKILTAITLPPRVVVRNASIHSINIYWCQSDITKMAA